MIVALVLIVGLAVGTTGSSASAMQGEVDRVTVHVRIESNVSDVPTDAFAAFVMGTLSDPRGWVAAGFDVVEDPSATYVIELDGPAQVDRRCAPLLTHGSVSCQNGPTVALNAERWRHATSDWDLSLEDYRRYMVNHEVGHLLGQRHPEPRCPITGTPNAVMEQQTKGLAGCLGNAWPLRWELERATARPPVLAPPPEWGPTPIPRNLGGSESTVSPSQPATSTTSPAIIAPTSAPGEAGSTTLALSPTAAPSLGPHDDGDLRSVASPASPDRVGPITAAIVAAGTLLMFVVALGARRRRR